MAITPPLPLLHGDLMLDVFNHRSLSQGDLNDQVPHGNSDRLAQVGQSVLDTIVTFILIAERPMLCGEEFKARHEHALSDQSIVYWVNAYDTDLKKRVRVASRDILDDPNEARFLFNSYVGAVCFQYGLQATADWISKLVKPDDEPVLMENLGSRPTTSSPGLAHTHAGALQASASASAAAPPPYYVSPPKLPTPPPGVPQGTLAIFNQTCNQLGITVGWESSSHGPQHEPRWEVKCTVNGVQRGAGLGRNQKAAKEAAAREAWQYMTSVNWTLQQPEPTA